MTTINLELKSVKNKRQKKLCATCLSFVNSQCPISEDIKGILKCLLYDFGIDEFFQSLPPGKELKLCCKCNATLKDMIAFKVRGQNSFCEIRKYWCSNWRNENPRQPIVVHGQGNKPTITLTPQQCTLKYEVQKKHTNEKQNPIEIVKEEVADIDDSNDDTIYESEVAARPIEQAIDYVADIAYTNDDVFIKVETDIDTSITTVPISNMDPITNIRPKKVCFTCLSLTFKMESKMVPITEDIKCMLKRLLYDYDINGFFELVPPGKVLELCCECNVILKDMAAFKERVQKSFDELRKYWGPLKQNENPRRPDIVQGQRPTTTLTPLKDNVLKEHTNEKQNPTGIVKENVADIDGSNDDTIYESEAAARPIEKDNVLKKLKHDVADIAYLNDNVFIKAESDIDTSVTAVPISNMDPITNTTPTKVCFTCLSLTFTIEHKMVPINEDIKGMLKRLLYDYDINGLFELVPPGKVLELCWECNVIIEHITAFKECVQKSFDEFRKCWGPKKKNITHLSCSTKVKDNKKRLSNENLNPIGTVNEDLTDIVNPFDNDFVKEENDTDMMYEPEAAAEPIKNYKVLKIVKEDAVVITDRNENVFIKTEADMGTTYQPEPTVMKDNENATENVSVAICNAKFKETDKNSNHDIVPLVKYNNAINKQTSSVVKHITIEHFSNEAGEEPDIEKSIQSTILFRKQNIDLPVEISNKSNSNTLGPVFLVRANTPKKIHPKKSKRNVSFDEKKVEDEGKIGIGEDVILKPKFEEGTFTIENPSVAATLESPNVVILSPKIVSAQSIAQGSISSSNSESENALESDKTSSIYTRQAMTLQGQRYGEHSQQKLNRRHTEDDGTAQTKKFKRHTCFYS